MKITKSQLKQIIKEEVESSLNELGGMRVGGNSYNLAALEPEMGEEPLPDPEEEKCSVHLDDVDMAQMEEAIDPEGLQIAAAALMKMAQEPAIAIPALAGALGLHAEQIKALLAKIAGSEEKLDEQEKE